jgi:hypothetical protein
MSGNNQTMDVTQSPQGLLKFMAFMESLSPETCQALEDVYERELSFEDPINQASNIPELRALFEDLFKQLKQIRIEIKHHALGGKRHFISWHMAYTFRGKPRSLDGVSEIELGPTSKVCWQRDYWDASTGVYAEFPLMRTALGALKKLVAVKQPAPKG